jgi:hypothetical protein
MGRLFIKTVNGRPAQFYANGERVPGVCDISICSQLSEAVIITVRMISAPENGDGVITIGLTPSGGE